MRVYDKKRIRLPIILGYIFTITSLIFAIVILYLMYKRGSFYEAINIYIGPFTFAVVFLIFSACSFFDIVKKPTPYKAKLVSKKEDKVDGKKVTSMVFEIDKPKTKKKEIFPNVWECYTYEKNNLEVDKKYTIYIKEYNWELKYVDEK